jgi:hypothetical protein
MDQVLNGLDFAFVYLDDVLIGSSSPEEHLLHLRLFLQQLRQYGLVLNMEKCELGRAAFDFLGHHITAKGAEPVVKHVEVIKQFPWPADCKQLQSFLGLVNFYRRFIPAASQILFPLTKALKGDRPSSLYWTPARQHSFEAIHTRLYSRRREVPGGRWRSLARSWILRS